MFELYAAITRRAIVCRAAEPYGLSVVSQGVTFDKQEES